MKTSILDSLTPHYIVDAAGKKIGVILDVATFKLMLEELEDMHDARHAEILLAAGEEEEGRTLDEFEKALHKKD